MTDKRNLCLTMLLDGIIKWRKIKKYIYTFLGCSTVNSVIAVCHGLQKKLRHTNIKKVKSNEIQNNLSTTTKTTPNLQKNTQKIT